MALGNPSKPPLLDQFYQQYLRDENSARFMDRVTRYYCIGTLERLALGGRPVTRRAAFLSLGCLGDFSQLELFGQGLHDSDRGVRVLSDHGLRLVSFRQGSLAQQQLVQRLARLNLRHCHEQALCLADELIADSEDSLAEARYQRGVSHFALAEYNAARADFTECLYLNRYHFQAAVGAANCSLEQDDIGDALESFRLAIAIHPDLEGIRHQIVTLEKTQEG